MKRLGRYLITTHFQGVILRPTDHQSHKCWVDANFAGGFNCKIAGTDPTTAKSCSGWVITYAGSPVMWSSKMQTLTALSMTEAEYIALLTALRCDLIPMIELSKEKK